MLMSKWIVGLGMGGFIAAITITPSDVTATLVALAALVAALGTAISNIITARSITRKVEAVSVAVAEVDKETKVITGHVNSAASKAAEKIDALQAEVKRMREEITEKKQEAALVAQSVAAARIHQPVPTPASVPGIDTKITVDKTQDHLEKIEVNTKAIEQNTASTEAKVDNLKDK